MACLFASLLTVVALGVMWRTGPYAPSDALTRVMPSSRDWISQSQDKQKETVEEAGSSSKRVGAAGSQYGESADRDEDNDAYNNSDGEALAGGKETVQMTSETRPTQEKENIISKVRKTTVGSSGATKILVDRDARIGKVHSKSDTSKDSASAPSTEIMEEEFSKTKEKSSGKSARKGHSKKEFFDTFLATAPDDTIVSKALHVPRAEERRFYVETYSDRICFHHVPKTGGTNFVFMPSFKAVFHWKEFEDKNKVHQGSLLGEWMTYTREGHAGHPTCKDGMIVSLLRDPVERYLSAYRNAEQVGLSCNLQTKDFAKQCECCGVNFNWKLALAFRTGNMGIIEFLNRNYIPDNQMTRMLLGNKVVDICKKFPQRCREVILHKLKANFLLLGFSEYYGDFQEMFSRLFGMFNNGTAYSGEDPDSLQVEAPKQYVWVNRTVVEVEPEEYSGLTKAFEDLGKNESQHIIKYSDVDIVFYDVARDLFHPDGERLPDYASMIIS